MNDIAKKLLSVLLTLALLCGLTAVAAQGYGAGTKFVVLGDSISAGEGASDPAKAYARLIADTRDYDLDNHSVGGNDSNDLLKILEERADVRADIAAADIINLSIGGNDLLHTNVITMVLRVLFMNDETAADEYIEAFRVNFALIIEKIRALNPDALFIVQTPYNSMQGVPLVAGAYETVLIRLNKVYAEYLAENPEAYKLADMLDMFKGREGLVYPDRIHPSDAGHELIAEVLTAVIGGTQPNLEPVSGEEPGFFENVWLFLVAVYEYLSYWLSIYSPLELLEKAISFII